MVLELARICLLLCCLGPQLSWFHTFGPAPPQACEEVGIASFGADLPDTATQVRGSI